MTGNKRFTVDGLTITENSQKGRKYLLEYQGGVNALCNRINGLFDKSERLEKENEQLKKEIVKFKKWEKHIRDVKREDLDKVFKMSIYEIAEAFKYYQERIKELYE